MTDSRGSLSVREYLLLSIIILLVASLTGCQAKTSSKSPGGAASTDQSGNTTRGKYDGKKVVFVNSYHQGYAWSDGVEKGVHSTLDNTGVELKFIDLDTKNNPGVDFGKNAGERAWSEIQDFQPDAVIACDDNAQKYLVVPFMKGGSIPVVYAGVNWDASAYGYDDALNVTGVLEVELPNQLFELLKGYGKGERIGYVSIDTETERKVVDIYNQRFFNGQMKVYWAKTLEEFKSAFLSAQQEVDIIFLGNNAGADQWDDGLMRQFFLDNTQVPTGSINDWMAPYTLLTLAKSAEEQGQLAAQDVLQILDGTQAKQIPVVENKKGNLILNLLMADKLGVVFSPSMLKNAVIIDN